MRCTWQVQAPTLDHGAVQPALAMVQGLWWWAPGAWQGHWGAATG